MEMTREEAIRNYREHWASLAVTGSEDKTEYLVRHGYSRIINNCFLCDFTKSKSCSECPIEWSKTRKHTGGVLCMGSYYADWLDATTAEERKRLAALIRDFPEKKEKKTKPKFAVGDKVMPVSKSLVGGGYADSLEESVWEEGKKQGYLFVTTIVKEGVYKCDDVMSNMSGDAFLESDLIPYVEPKPTPIYSNRTETVEYLEIETDNIKIVYNGPTTICIINYDGKEFKGIAKCNPADTYNENIGRVIATERASIQLSEYRIAQAR